MLKKIIVLFVVAVVLLVAWAFIRGPEDTWLCVDGQWVKHGVPSAPKPTEPCKGGEITNFDECMAAGYPVMESYPRQCKTDDETFVEDIGNELEKIDLIRIDNPRPNQTISSPLEISGEARGFWFFEADFPIRLLDESGAEIAVAIAQAQGEWMTEEFVGFTATLEFSTATSTKGTLILEKDNPSGLSEHSDQLIVPVRF